MPPSERNSVGHSEAGEYSSLALLARLPTSGRHRRSSARLFGLRISSSLCWPSAWPATMRDHRGCARGSLTRAKVLANLFATERKATCWWRKARANQRNNAQPAKRATSQAAAEKGQQQANRNEAVQRPFVCTQSRSQSHSWPKALGLQTKKLASKAKHWSSFERAFRHHLAKVQIGARNSRTSSLLSSSESASLDHCCVTCLSLHERKLPHRLA